MSFSIADEQRTQSEPNLQSEELRYVTTVLVPEFIKKFKSWNEEYKGHERDLGIRGEFANLWRKARKLKSVLWDGADDSAWREGARVILFEVAAHAFLMLFDYDKAERSKEIRLLRIDPGAVESTSRTLSQHNSPETIGTAKGWRCKPPCEPGAEHTFRFGCAYKDGIGTKAVGDGPS